MLLNDFQASTLFISLDVYSWQFFSYVGMLSGLNQYYQGGGYSVLPKDSTQYLQWESNQRLLDLKSSILTWPLGHCSPSRH